MKVNIGIEGDLHTHQEVTKRSVHDQRESSSQNPARSIIGFFGPKWSLAIPWNKTASPSVSHYLLDYLLHSCHFPRAEKTFAQL